MKIMVQMKEFLLTKIYFWCKNRVFHNILPIMEGIYTYWTSFIGANVFLLVTITLFCNLIWIIVQMKEFKWKKIIFGAKTGFPLHF